MVTVVIIMIKAVGVDQAHGAVGGSAAMDPDCSITGKKPGESNRRKRKETRKHKTAGERGRTVSNNHF